jgi:hypothetical protein
MPLILKNTPSATWVTAVPLNRHFEMKAMTGGTCQRGLLLQNLTRTGVEENGVLRIIENSIQREQNEIGLNR